MGGVKMLLAAAGLVLLMLFIQSTGRRPENSPCVLVPAEPSQTPTVERTWQKNGYDITALARFQIEALVLSTEPYWFDPGSALSPLDLALGWGPVSDPAVAGKLYVSQGGRWYHFRPDSRLKLATDEIISHSANMHMIPADGAVEKQLKSVGSGDIVDLTGYLVEVHGPRGFKWRSSLTRTDTGAGACELVWVEEVSKQK